MLSTRFGSSTVGFSANKTSATRIGIRMGYKTGAGSKAAGIRTVLMALML